jgi:hypothetical protein
VEVVFNKKELFFHTKEMISDEQKLVYSERGECYPINRYSIVQRGKD